MTYVPVYKITMDLSIVICIPHSLMVVRLITIDCQVGAIHLQAPDVDHEGDVRIKKCSQ